MPAPAGLFLPPGVRDAIVRHAESAYPEECCGTLIGRRSGPAVEVVRAVPAANERLDRPLDRFSIAPADLLAAHKAARAVGLEVVGYYHSHPDHPARPSGYDREHAFPGASFVIVEVARGQAGEIRSWRQEGEGGEMTEEAVSLAPFPHPAHLS